MPARTLIAVPITSAAPPLVDQVTAARAAGADLAELRVDLIGDVPAVERLLAGPRLLPVILTLRPSEEGGAWAGTETERLALLGNLASLSPDYIDIEYATWLRSPDLRRKLESLGAASPGADAESPSAARPTPRLILSHHDLERTPADCGAVFERLAATPAEIIKVVFAARDATDACRVLVELRRRAAQRPTIALAMGEAGLATRVLARKFGGFLTFAAVQPGQESAPGQPTIAELRQCYRWERIGSATRVFGVVGWPVTHSQSPLVHNAAMEAAGIDGVYVAFHVERKYEDFAAFMDLVTGQPALEIVGLSVTLPHKGHALRWLEERGGLVSNLAKRCGAVNTLTRRPNGQWEGDNSDAPAALAALQATERCAGDRLRTLRVDVLGAGGVARAVVVALRGLGCEVTIYNRSSQRAAGLAQETRCAWKPWTARTQYTGDVLINCTSVGMWPAEDESPLSDDALRPGALVFDTVYRPAQTRLLRAASARGCAVIGGLEMFIGQAEAQYLRWHGQPAPPEVMRRAVSESAG